MINLKITPYTLKDNASALALEAQCVQGKSLVLQYLRPTFHARSEVYQKYNILNAKVDNKLVGTTAWAEKRVLYHEKWIQTAYLYDLRVHPAYRNKGVAIYLARRLFKELGNRFDCIYTLVTGENERCLKPAQRLYGLKWIIPLTYLVIPVYKYIKEKTSHDFTSAHEVHEMYLKKNQMIDFIPEFDEKKQMGHVMSIVSKESGVASCSVWTNENLLAEKVVTVPRVYRIQRMLTQPLKLFLKLPYIPKSNDILQSFFLYDFFANDEKSMYSLLSKVNNIALKQDRKYLYILLQNNDPLLPYIKKFNRYVFTFSYYLLAKGPVVPDQSERIYIDIRDL